MSLQLVVNRKRVLEKDPDPKPFKLTVYSFGILYKSERKITVRPKKGRR